MNRHNARIGLVRCIYALDFNPGISQMSSVLDDLKLDTKAFDYIENSIYDIKSKLAEIDEMIKPHLNKWTIDRLTKVDLAILRVAVYELKFCDDIPAGASINEAVDIAKEYSTEASGKYVNGVLSSVLKSL